MKNIRILLADDHKVVREGLRRALEETEGMEVVGEAENGREAVQIASAMLPDVVLMDISMPGLNGIEATRQIGKESPSVKVLILSMHSDKRFVQRALMSGVSGYLLKNSAISEVAGAINSVIAGQIYLSPGITNVVVEGFMRHALPEDVKEAEQLTAREREILQLLAEGASTKEIAASLHISEKTVEGHRQRLMEKLDIHSVALLTKYAIREGLTTLDN